MQLPRANDDLGVSELARSPSAFTQRRSLDGNKIERLAMHFVAGSRSRKNYVNLSEELFGGIKNTPSRVKETFRGVTGIPQARSTE